MKNIDELKAAWNEQADRLNQWDDLGLDEIAHFAQKCALIEAAEKFEGSVPFNMPWRTDAPTVADLNGQAEEYFWIRGGNFNRMLMVRADSGVTSEVIDGKRKFWPEVNFSFYADNLPGAIWRHDLQNWPGIGSLEWAGPVPRPMNNASLTRCGTESGWRRISRQRDY